MTHDRDELERLANIQPSRLERRLARNQLNSRNAVEASDNASFGAIGRIVIGLLTALGFVAAMIPTLIYFAIILTPLLMMYTCMSHF